MTFTPLTPQAILGPYVTPGTLALALAFAASDASNGNSFVASGKEIVVLYNSDSAPHTVTFDSVADGFGRTGDITAYNVPAGTYAMFNVGQLTGWKQADGTFRLQTSDATLKVAIIRLP